MQNIMDIQPYCEGKAREVADVFYQSVHGIDASLYSDQQKEAWAPSPINYEQWAKRLRIKQPWLALIEGRVAGFIELDADGHIDCTYTHPDYQGRGVASALYDALLIEAKNRGMQRLYVEASLTAKHFFEKRGFVDVKRNEIERGGIILVNFSMEKQLT